MRKLLLVFLLASPGLFAQKKDLTEELAKKYPEESAVYLERKEHNTIRLEKGQLLVYTKTHEDLLLLSDKVNSYSDRPIYFSSFSEISSIKAQALVPDTKGSYTIVPVKEKYTTNEFSSGSFYDDMRATHLVYTGLTRGSRIQLDYTEKLKEPRFFGRYYFSTSISTEDAEYSVEVPEGVKIEWKLFNIHDEDLEFRQDFSKKKTKYTWRRKNSPKYKTENDAPGSLYFAPHIVVYIREYTVKKETKKLLDNPGSLYDWYYNMVKDVNASPDPALQHIVDSLVAGVTDEREKVKRIFYWVQDNVKYVAFEDGMGGFVPREANMICSRRYGDCKDMASIMTTMLKLAGIPAYLTWIGTRSIPYKYVEVPTPLSDNHMICTYISGGNYYFLDGTGKNTPFGTPTSMIQGKQALIGKGEGQFEIVTVPVIAANVNFRADTVYMHIDGHSVDGKGSMHAAGYEKIHLTYPLDGMTEKERRTFFRKYLAKGSNKFNVDSLEYANLYDRDSNLVVKYRYSIGGYAHTNGDELYLNMQLDKSYMNGLLDSTERSAPLEIDYMNEQTDVSILEIPAGYAVDCLPADCVFNGADFGFSLSYRREGDRVIAIKKIYIRTLLVQPAQFAEWNRFIAALTEAYNENITLQKIPLPSPAPKKSK